MSAQIASGFDHFGWKKSFAGDCSSQGKLEGLVCDGSVLPFSSFDTINHLLAVDVVHLQRDLCAAHFGTPGIITTLEVIQRQFGRPVTRMPPCDPDYSPSVEVLTHLRRTSLRRACSFVPAGTLHICSAGLAAAPGGSRAIRKLDRGDQVDGKR